MMTAALIAHLRTITQEFVDRQNRVGRVTFSQICEHTSENGFMTVDREMFREWVSNNIRGPIDYDN